MASSGWKQIMEDLLEGAGRELRSSAPTEIRATLNAFRARLRALRVAGGRKKFEEEVEAFLQSDPSLRTATERYLGKKTKLAAERVVAVLKKMEAVLAKVRTNRRT